MRDTVRSGLRRSLSSRSFIATTVCVALLSLSACGGGGGGGGGSSTPPPSSSGSNPPPPAANTAPTVNAGPDQSIQLPATATLAGSATDAENNALTYTWSGPSGMTFDNASSPNAVATFSAAGSYTLTLTANDGTLNGTDTVVINVTAAPAQDATFPTAGTSGDSNRGWEIAAQPADVGLDASKLQQAQQYSDSGLSAGTYSSGAVVYKGRIAYYWGGPNGTKSLGAPLYDVKSTTKSMGGVTLGLALDQGLVHSLDDKAVDYFQGSPVTFGRVEDTTPPTPPNDSNLLSQITLLELATHTSGFAKKGDYCQLLSNTVPGTVWAYSDCGLNWLADALTNAFNKDLATVAQEGVWDKIGILANADIKWRDNTFRPDGATSDPKRRELAAGITANINAMARVGLLFLNNGSWNGVPVLSKSFVDSVHTPPAAVKATTNSNEANYPLATSSYGVLWWTNTPDSAGAKPMPNVPDDAYWAWGLNDSLIVVIPSKQLVIARAQVTDPNNPNLGLAGRLGWNGQAETYLQPLIQPIVESVQ